MSDVQHDVQWSRMSFDMDYLLGTLPTDPVILRFIDDVRWLRAQLVESEATLATIGGADKATLARKLRRANAATRDAEVRATESDARATKAATYLRQTYSDLRAMALSAGHTRDALGIVTHLRIDAPVLFHIQSRLDAACADCDAFSVAPATQPDEWAAAERAVIEQAREVLSLMPNTANSDVWKSTPDGDPCIPWTIHAVTILAIDDLRDALLALDATDGAAKEET